MTPLVSPAAQLLDNVEPHADPADIAMKRDESWQERFRRLRRAAQTGRHCAICERVLGPQVERPPEAKSKIDFKKQLCSSEVDGCPPLHNHS
jgi:hypothetical protein